MNIENIIKELFKDNLKEDKQISYKAKDNSFKYEIKAKKYKTKKEYMINYSFTLNPKNESKMYEIAWKIESEDLNKLKGKFISILEKIKNRKEELKITN